MAKAAKKKVVKSKGGASKPAKSKAAKPAKKLIAKSKAKPAVKMAAKKPLEKAPKLLKKEVKEELKATKTAAPVKAATSVKPAPPKAAQKLEKAVQSGKLSKKAQALAELISQQQKDEPEVVLTNADGKQYCRVHDCDNESTTDGHCRFHYLALWKRNKVKAKILLGGKLDKYIEDLTSKYPDKYLEMLRKDLASEKDFNLIIAEMDVEDSGDEAEAEEETSRFIEEVRGGMPSTSDDDDGGF